MPEMFMSDWKPVEFVPESYVFPPEKRPGKLTFPSCQDIPVIDLQNPQHIIKACQDFGFFQVINHGVDESLMEEAMSVLEELFQMPADYKAEFYSKDVRMNQKCRIYSSTLNYDTEEVHFWRDCFTHHCHPLEDNIPSWPEKPARYREVISAYSVQVREVLLGILELIGEGVGLKPGYFEGEITKTQSFSANYHIPCPDPSLALAMPEHFDPILITVLHQRDVPGLQVFKDGQWLGVQTLPNSLLVIPGLLLQIISNDTFKSPLHRVVPNDKEIRTTLCSFFMPSIDALIEPAEALVKAAKSPPVYKAFTYKEFFADNMGKCWGSVLKSFKN